MKNSEPRWCGRIEPGSAHPAQLWAPASVLGEHRFVGAGCHPHVVVDEEDGVAGCSVDPQVALYREAGWSRVNVVELEPGFPAERFDFLLGIGRLARVDDAKIPRHNSLLHETLDRGDEQAGPVAGRNDETRAGYPSLGGGAHARSGVGTTPSGATRKEVPSISAGTASPSASSSVGATSLISRSGAGPDGTPSATRI